MQGHVSHVYKICALLQELPITASQRAKVEGEQADLMQLQLLSTLDMYI